jgi:uncharacterized membrane protein YkvA (DUF1232 family)
MSIKSFLDAVTLKGYAQSLKEKALVLWFARKHADTPVLAYVMAFLAVAYALSPIDLIPDFIPVLGRLDDILVLPAVIWLAFKLLPANVVEEAKAKADQWLDKEEYLPTSLIGMLTGSAGWVSAAWYVVHKFFL